jgi:hypothetical protein
VLFWLEQNAHAVKATIQALEVQRLTLTALSSMNVNLSEMAKAFRMPTAQTASPAPAAEAPAAPGAFSNWPLTSAATATPSEVPEPARAAAAPAPEPSAEAEEEPAEEDATPAAMADPMNWWGSLTRQFQSLAGAALQGGEAAVPGMAGIQAAQDMVKAAQASALAGAAAVSEQAAAMRKARAEVLEQVVARTPARKAAAKTAAKAPAKATKTVSKTAAKSAPRKSASRGK